MDSTRKYSSASEMFGARRRRLVSLSLSNRMHRLITILWPSFVDYHDFYGRNIAFKRRDVLPRFPENLIGEFVMAIV